MNNKLLAQNPVDLGQIGTGEGFGPFGNTSGVLSNPVGPIANLISTTVGLITVCAGIYFLFQLLTGAFSWMISSGDKGKLSTAQDRMLHAVIGLIIVVASYAIVSVVGGLLGFDILNPQNIVGALQLGGGTP